MDKLKELLCAIGGICLIFLIVIGIASAICLYFLTVINNYGFNILTFSPIVAILLIIII